MKYFYVFIFCIISSVSFGQANLHVIGAAGNTSTNGNNQLEWTIGEPIVNTATYSNHLLTQGFHQGALLITAVDEQVNSNISIFPNPTADMAIINLMEDNLTNAQYILSDMNGKVITQQLISGKQTKVSFAELASATYFIQVVTSNQKTRTFQVIKE